VDETQQYSAAEMERMMKVQDVVEAMAKKITWWPAAKSSVTIDMAGGEAGWNGMAIPAWRPARGAECAAYSLEP